MHRSITLASSLIAIAVLIAVASRAEATEPTPTGRIAFSRYRYTDDPFRSEIWVSNPNGNGLRLLSHAPPNVVDSSPDWAPSGSRLVFMRCPTGSGGDVGEGRCSIWSVNADGSGQRQLSPKCRAEEGTPSCPDDGWATYSPDGRRLVLKRGWAWAAHIAVTDTRLHHQRLIRIPLKLADIRAFAWSPSGTQIAFSAHVGDDPIRGRAIYVVNADGSGFHRLTPLRLHAGAGHDRVDWSPDGTRILFHSVTSDDNGAIPPDGDLYTIAPDGTGLRRLTHLPQGTGIELGSYSPDGRWIVFSTSSAATSGPSNSRPWPDVFVIRTDGTGLTPVTSTKNWEGSPAWAP